MNQRNRVRACSLPSKPWKAAENNNYFACCTSRASVNASVVGVGGGVLWRFPQIALLKCLLRGFWRSAFVIATRWDYILSEWWSYIFLDARLQICIADKKTKVERIYCVQGLNISFSKISLIIRKNYINIYVGVWSSFLLLFKGQLVYFGAGYLWHFFLKN